VTSEKKEKRIHVLVSSHERKVMVIHFDENPATGDATDETLDDALVSGVVTTAFTLV
jgi:GTP cyclohydrolase III